jgi:GT2 family glycosyltransferase
MTPTSSLPDPGESLFAVLVLYQQSLEQSATFQSLTAAVRRLPGPLSLLVYDNSPTPLGHPRAGSYPGWDIQYVHDPSNPGISQAYLTGARMAARRSKQWLLLLDQDTRFAPDALARYIGTIRQHPEVRLFAPILKSGERVLSPCLYRFKLGFPAPRVHPGAQSLTGLSVLNSGMCVSVQDYLAVGGHDVRIALDFADHEFIERFKQRYDTFVVVDTECSHDFFRVTTLSTASHLARFEFYCRGAKYASKGLMDGILTVGVVGARACVLSVRHRSLGFLRVAAGTLLGRKPRD